METEKPSSMETQLNRWLTITALFGILLLGLYFWWFHHLNRPLSTDSQDWSAIGEYFNGFVSPILSFIMILAVIKTITLQRQLINEQRDQITKSNNLMRVSTAIQGVSSLMNHHENIKNTFRDFNKKYSDDLTIYLASESQIALQQKISNNTAMISAHQHIVSECSNAIRTLMESTPDTAERDILYAGKLIDGAVVKYLLPLAKKESS